MVNKRFLQTAKRWKNPSLPTKKIQEVKQKNPINNFSENPNNSFLFSYYGTKKDLKGLIKGKKAEIPTGNSGEIQGHLIKRWGLITTIYNNPQLKSANLYPITPAQSEALLKEGKLTNPGDNWEDFGMVLYDRSENGYNPKEAQVLYESLKKHRQDLSLSQNDLENKLIIVNAGAEVDSSMLHGIKPIVLPGLTQVYQHEVLEKVGEDPEFDGYGLNGGLPLLNQLGSGSRTLYMPNEDSNLGLRVLYRGRVHDLNARDGSLASSYDYGRVNFARSASP